MSSQDFVAGSVVRWPSAPGAPYGVILEADFSRIKVRFDGDNESKMFSTKAGVIERVHLDGPVRRTSTGAVGFVYGQSSTDPPRWQVLIDGKLITVSEADLRPHVLNDPHSKIIEGRLGIPRQFALALTARRYELEHLTNELVSLGESRVDVKPHQVSVVHRVISNYPHRFLLCDEVGLGKTIEAGLVLKELRARGNVERVLVIVPPNLVRQWQFELKSKFNEVFSILNTDTVRYLESAQAHTGNPFETHDSVIVSSAWVTGPKWSKLVTEVPWDMVIVDEAHHARVRFSGKKRNETRLYKVVRDLVSPDAFSKRAALLLTATPMQLDTSELYSLIELLDPALFPTEQHFDHHRSQVPGLSRLVHELTINGFPVAGNGDDDVEQVANWLDISPDEAHQRLTAGPDGIASVCEDLSSRHLLSEVLIRNRKKIVGGFMPRQAFRWEVELSEPERRALRAVEDYVREGYAQADRTNDAAIGFVMVIFQKLMASSIRALRTSLDRRRQRLDDRTTSATGTKRIKKRIEELEAQFDDDEVISELLAELAVADAEEAAELKRLVELLDAVPVDSKAETLVDRLAELKELDPNAKVLLFTEFRETQEYLRERLQEIGWDVYLFHGQLKTEQKDASVEEFRASDEASILISTEAGGEGRNFQFCHLLVNYDLPWNPMRIEQRIGRVDRIGQEHTVQVFNFWVRGTVEERVLNVLERRINIFEDTVGGLDPILGDAERDLAKIMRLGGEERDRALARFEQQIEKKIKNARAAEEKLRDFIMETKSYSHEIASLLIDDVTSISNADLERFVRRLLLDVRTDVQPNGDGTYEITFREPFVSEYPEHVKDAATRRRTVAMRPDVKPDSEHVEYMALGHRIVDDLIGRVTSLDYAGSAAAIRIDDDEELPAAQGWLVAYELGVPAIKEVRELFAAFVHDDMTVDVDLGAQLVQRASLLPRDEALIAEDVPTDSLDPALEAAESTAFSRLSTLEERARTDTARRVDRERAKLIAYFDYRDQAAQDRLASSRRTLAGLEASDVAEQRKILPVWRSNVARDEQLIEDLKTDRTARLEQLDQQAYGSGDLRLIAAARVEIVHEEES